MVPACHGFLNASGLLPSAASKAPVHIPPAGFHNLLAHPLVEVHSARRVRPRCMGKRTWALGSDLGFSLSLSRL